MIAGLAWACALGAAAQSPQPYMEPAASAGAAASGAAPSSSTQTAVAAPSSASPVGHGVGIAGAGKPLSLPRPIHAVIHKDSADWAPVSLRAGGDPGAARTRAALRIRGAKARRRGTESYAKAIARLRKAGDDRWLTISVFPRALEKRRKHFEVRLKLVEGYVEEAKAALVTVVDRRAGVGAGQDADEMTRQAVEFEEEFPSSGEILISALDPRPSAGAFNAGVLRGASFADRDAGLVDAAWSVRGLPKAR
jgi:hypothetical protein